MQGMVFKCSQGALFIPVCAEPVQPEPLTHLVGPPGASRYQKTSELCCLEPTG